MSKKQAIIDGINNGDSFEEIVLASGAKSSYVKKVFTEQGVEWEKSDDPKIELKTIAVEVEEQKEESNLLGKLFVKTINNPLMIKHFLITKDIKIEDRHISTEGFERIFMSQVEKGILKEVK